MTTLPSTVAELTLSQSAHNIHIKSIIGTELGIWPQFVQTENRMIFMQDENAESSASHFLLSDEEERTGSSSC